MIKHLDGICHVFIDNEVHIEKALRIAINAKTQRYGTYNTMEALLVHTAIAENILPVLASKYKQLDMELQGCYKVIQILKNMVFPAIESDWKEEYLALILLIKIVNSLDEAIINHINRYDSHHTDSIISNNYGNILGSSSKLTLSVLW